MSTTEIFANQPATVVFHQINMSFLAEPQQPLLTGPSTVIAGFNYMWTCVCTGGRPAPTMIMRIENVIFTSAVSQTNILQSDDTYNITSILSWTPTVGNIGNTLYCEILHAETLGNNSKNARIQLTVNGTLKTYMVLNFASIV